MAGGPVRAPHRPRAQPAPDARVHPRIGGRARTDLDQVLDVLETLQAFVHGYVLDEITEQEAQRRTGLTMSEAQQQHESHVRRIMESGRYPQFARVVIDSADDLDPDMVFERRLRYILDGLATAFP